MTDKRVERSSRRWAGVRFPLEAIVAVVAFAVLVGWLFDVPRLTDVRPSFSSAKLNVALALLAGSAGLWLVRTSRPGTRRRTIGRCGGAFMMAIGLVTLAEYVFGVDLRIDEAFFDDASGAVGTATPGRMGINSAACFAASGAAVLLIDRSWRAVQAAAVSVGALAFVALLGYVYGVPRLESGLITQRITPMALPTAVALFVFAAALLCATSAYGLSHLAASRGAGGAMIRRVFPAVLLVPPLLGYLVLAGRNANLFEREAGLALYATTLVLVFAAFAWWVAQTIERADQVLRESEERKGAMIESSLDCVTSIDREGRIVDFNAAAELTFGYRREEVVGRLMAEVLVPPALRPFHLAGFAHHLATGEAKLLGKRTELTALRSDGSEFPVELLISRTSLRGSPFFVGYLRDLSERKEAEARLSELEDQLRQAQRLEAIGMLAGGVAHDFNNLLTVISGYTELLRADDRLGSRADLDQIASAAERAQVLTRQLLAFSRRQVLQPRSVDLNRIVEGVTSMLERLIGEDIALVEKLDPRIATTIVDPGQLEQVILNLAINARDAMPGGGTLMIETANVELGADYVAQRGDAAPGPHVMLAVSDTGTGMDEATIGRIFDPFFTTKDVGSGTGLGLATVYGIVKQSGGNIWVYSEPGRGSTFKVYLPAADDRVDADALPEPLEDTPASGSETILVVEDDEAVRAMVARMLEANGYSVITAGSHAEALAVVASRGGTIDLLLSDLVMPDGNGVDLAVDVAERLPDLPVVLMSGYSDALVTHRGTDGLHGAAFIEKPFSAADLARKIRSVLAGA